MALYDPLSEDFRADRSGVYREIRDDAPVYLQPDGRFAALSRFDDVRAAASDWQTYSAVTAEAAILRPIINDMDPPLHTARRAITDDVMRIHGPEGNASPAIAFEELLACMPEFEVVAPPERIPSVWAWGFESLRVEFAPRDDGR